jgi:hypothetical protein
LVPGCSRGSGIQEFQECFKDCLTNLPRALGRHFPESAASYRQRDLVKDEIQILELDCYAVRRELVNWMEDDLAPELRAQIDLHLQNCGHCIAIYDGAQNVVRLLNDERAIELPADLSRRLYQKLFRQI